MPVGGEPPLHGGTSGGDGNPGDEGRRAGALGDCCVRGRPLVLGRSAAKNCRWNEPPTGSL
jgi:hypothetical protein